MTGKKSKHTRIPRDVTIGDLVAFAESIGCIVEVKLVDRDAEQCVHRKVGDGTEPAQEVGSSTEIENG